jgi:hypothetical protein
MITAGRGRQVGDLGVDGLGRLRGPREVLVQGVDPQDPGLAVGGSVELADQPVAVEHRQREVAPPALGDGLVHLQLIVELEQLGHALAVVDEPVERGQQRRPAGERLP